MLVTSNYNRSEILSFYDLNEDQKINVLDSMEEEQAENDSFVIFKGKKFIEVLPLSMFMKVNYGLQVNNKPTLWDGVYSTSYFSAYFIKISKSGDMALVAEKFS